MTADPGKHSASAASTFSAFERSELVATALGLPSTWVVTVEPPYGQIRIEPVKGAHWKAETLVATPRGRCDPVHWRPAR